MNFDADNTQTETGVWKEFDGSQFLIAHTSSLKFQRALARAQQPYRKKIENGTIDPKLQRTLICQAMSEGMLLDWKNVTNSAKEDVPYSQEKAAELLIRNGEFRDFVSEVSMNLELFRKEDLEDVGNG